MRSRTLANLVLVGAVGIGTITIAPSAHAASTLDQSVTGTTHNTTFTSTQWLGQSFTAGITGALTRIDIPIQKYGTPTEGVTVSVYAAASGIPTGPALASAVLSPGAIPQFGGAVSPLEVALSPAPRVVSGTQYVYTLATTQVYASPYNFYVAFAPAPGDVYAGGSDVFCLLPCGWSANPGYEYSFATYVDPGDPGEPSVTTPQRTLDFVAEGGTCTSTSATRMDNTWLQLPDASACTKPGYRLAGWVARQTDGPPAIVFAPGGWTFMTGDNHVHALWEPAA